MKAYATPDDEVLWISSKELYARGVFWYYNRANAAWELLNEMNSFLFSDYTLDLHELSAVNQARVQRLFEMLLDT